MTSYKNREKDEIPDWDQIRFKNEVPRPWERMEETKKAKERRYVEVEIPADLLKGSGPRHFPLKRVWRWAKKNYPDRKFFFRGHKLFMIKE